jgi:hypothetical protein
MCVIVISPLDHDDDLETLHHTHHDRLHPIKQKHHQNNNINKQQQYLQLKFDDGDVVVLGGGVWSIVVARRFEWHRCRRVAILCIIVVTMTMMIIRRMCIYRRAIVIERIGAGTDHIGRNVAKRHATLSTRQRFINSQSSHNNNNNNNVSYL